MPNDPGHFLGRALRSCHDDIAFILPIHVVYYDYTLSARDGLQSVLDGVKL